MWASLRDTFLVGQFEVLRAIRTWRAVALGVLYLVATSGGTWMFTRLILAFENQMARTLGVPTTDRPGTMMDTLLEMEDFRTLLGAMLGDPALVDVALSTPLLAIFHLWFGLLLLPFLSTTTAAECISVDMRNRAVRFELLRTGRLELVFGRLGGQAVLTAFASALGAVAAFVVAWFAMVLTDPIDLALAMANATAKAWTFGLPFLGVGVACSQLTVSPAWARVLAVAATGGSWVAYGVTNWAKSEGFVPVVLDSLLTIFPQTWIRGLWEPGLQWVVSSSVFFALALAVTALGFIRMSRRDV